MYKKYSKDYLHCPCCSKLVNLYYSTQHLKTKNCQSLKKLMDEKDYDVLYLKFIREINKLKSDIRLSED